MPFCLFLRNLWKNTVTISYKLCSFCRNERKYLRIVMMNALDERLIAALRHDARASLSDLALLLNVSRTTVRSRIERLQQSGVIIGFSVVLQNDAKQDPVRGLMMIAVEGRGTDRIIRQMNGLPEVRALHSTNGRWDLIAEIATQTLDEFDTVLGKIRKIDGIVRSETNLLLSTKKRG